MHFIAIPIANMYIFAILIAIVSLLKSLGELFAFYEKTFHLLYVILCLAVE